MSNVKITLVPYAGLCNRLNAIASGVAYKKKHPNVDLKILWHKWFHCNCRYSDLFKQLPSQYPPVQELTWQIKDLPGHKLNFNIPQKLRGLWYDFSFLDCDNADFLTKKQKAKRKSMSAMLIAFAKKKFIILSPKYSYQQKSCKLVLTR